MFFFPLDFSWAVRRAFERLHPQLCIMMEGEVWPNFTAIAERRSVPVVVANGRIGQGKGWPRYRKIASLVRPMFGRVRLVLAQDEVNEERFEFLGVRAERLKVVGTLKYDTAELGDAAAGTDELSRQLALGGGELVWVAGQTGPGEEQIVLDCFEQLQKRRELKSLRLVIVPRKPERFDEVARQIESRGAKVLRYSAVKSGEYQVTWADESAVILGDTMGDLRKFYSVASVAFVGRSLAPMGGSDVMEVAALGKAIVVGRHTENFAQTIEALSAADAVEVVADGDELHKAVERLLLDGQAAEAMGGRAREVIVRNRGATQRTVAEIAELLGYVMPLRTSEIATEAIAAKGNQKAKVKLQE